MELGVDISYLDCIKYCQHKEYVLLYFILGKYYSSNVVHVQDT
jgi:hypothetical protein